jgi:hypothetical protein
MVLELNKVMEIINTLPSAWTGHKDFAHWLVKRMQPKITVELGVDHGFSLFSLAVDNPGQVYGIDLFEGDAHAGGRNAAEQFAAVEQFKNDNGFTNVTVLKDKFSAVAATWTEKVDILHIDGLHHYDSVKEDYKTWAPHLHEKSVILFHDTSAYPEGPGRFFSEQKLPRAAFSHSAGLGVMTADQELLDAIIFEYPHIISDCYTVA